MDNCNDPRNKCGSVIPSSCVPFTGAKPSFVSEEDFPCNVNMDDMIKNLSTQIEEILAGIDLTLSDKRCLDYNPETVTVSELQQIHNDELCAFKARIETLEESVNSLNIASKLISLNLGCMTPSTNPCSPNTNLYTLYYILNTFKTELCAIKTHLGI